MNTISSFFMSILIFLHHKWFYFASLMIINSKIMNLSVHFSRIQISYGNSPIFWYAYQMTSSFVFLLLLAMLSHRSWWWPSCSSPLFSTWVVCNKHFGDRRLTMGVDKNYWSNFLFLFLEHWYHKNSSIVCTYKLAWVINWCIHHWFCYNLIRKEELELVFVVIIPHD